MYTELFYFLLIGSGNSFCLFISWKMKLNKLKFMNVRKYPISKFDV